MINVGEAQSKTEAGFLISTQNTKRMVDEEVRKACAEGKSSVTLQIPLQIIDIINDYIRGHGFETRVSKPFSSICIFW